MAPSCHRSTNAEAHCRPQPCSPNSVPTWDGDQAAYIKPTLFLGRWGIVGYTHGRRPPRRTFFEWVENGQALCGSSNSSMAAAHARKPPVPTWMMAILRWWVNSKPTWDAKHQNIIRKPKPCHQKNNMQKDNRYPATAICIFTTTTFLL